MTPLKYTRSVSIISVLVDCFLILHVSLKASAKTLFTINDIYEKVYDNPYFHFSSD